MQEKEDKPDIIKDAIENDWLHVFFISNPVVSIVSRMVIDAYGLDERRVVCVSIRNADTSLVCSEPIKPRAHWYDRGMVKLFSDSPAGRRIVKQLNAKKERFIVYASWLYPEIEKATSSPCCKGHVYLEEGQQSYYQSKPYRINTHSWRQRKEYMLSGNVNYYFREDASAYIGLSDTSFPLIASNKRYVLENLGVVRQLYKPRLVGTKTIGLMPAPHRIPSKYLDAAIGLLLEKMPEGGVIKLHPGFAAYASLRDQVISIMERTPTSVMLCDDNIMLELEMLHEPKVVVGTRCSLSRYVETFGSKYEYVQFSGYIPPKN